MNISTLHLTVLKNGAITKLFQEEGPERSFTQGIQMRNMNGGMTYDAQYFW